MAYNRKDHFYKLAKKQGFRSRAAFKLTEIQEKYRLFKPGYYVVDLGCAPGGWLQISSELVGAEGKVFGIDLLGVDPLEEKNVFVVRGDIRDETTMNRLFSSLGRKVDVVTSDMAPDTSGVKFQDSFHSYQLAVQALDVCDQVLRQGGRFVVKVFPGDELSDLKLKMKEVFEEVHTFIPNSSRKTSSELYLVGKLFKKS